MTKPSDKKIKYPSTGIDYDLIFAKAKEDFHQIKQQPAEKHQQAKSDKPARHDVEEKSANYVYRFEVARGGGTYITSAPTIEEARKELLNKYAEILSLERAGGK